METITSGSVAAFFRASEGECDLRDTIITIILLEESRAR